MVKKAGRVIDVQTSSIRVLHPQSLSQPTLHPHHPLGFSLCSLCRFLLCFMAHVLIGFLHGRENSVIPATIVVASEPEGAQLAFVRLLEGGTLEATFADEVAVGDLLRWGFAVELGQLLIQAVEGSAWAASTSCNTDSTA